MRASRFLVLLGLVGLLAAVPLMSADQAASAMSRAANQFLGSLTPEQRQKAQFPLDSAERTHWHFIPTGPAAPAFPRNGLLIKEMLPAQRERAHALLKTGLSQHGYTTATAIMELETTLKAIELAAAAQSGRPPLFTRDPEGYFFSVFGTPADKGAWGWRVEGHHVSLHFTVVDGSVTVSAPTFFGSNPAEVREGEKKGLRVLGFEEDPARALLESLDAAQRAKATFNATAPTDILTMNTVIVNPLTPPGIAASEMSVASRQKLMAIVEAYTAQMAPEIAALRTSQLQKAGTEKIAFAWAGSAVKGEKHYYRVQGPTFLIEYDNTQNDGNHVHSVWRDFNGDFGRDLLREHLRSSAH